MSRFKNVLLASFLILFGSGLYANALKNFKIIATTNVSGETDPCGWKKKPLGGLARKATIIDEAKADGSPVFIIDGGNLFFKRDKISPGTSGNNEKITAESILESYNVMGCDGMTLGSKDFAAGVDYLKGLEEKANFPFVSANIRTTEGDLLFKPYVITRKGNIKVGVIGLTSAFSVDGIEVDPPIDALYAIVDEVADKSDIVTLLFHADDMDVKKIEDLNLPIDLIIQSKSRRRSNDGGDKAIPVFQCGERGKYLYEFEFGFAADNANIVDISSPKKTIEALDRQLMSLEKKTNSEVSSDDPEIQKTINEIADLKRQKAKAQSIINNAHNYLTFERIEMGKKVADRPDILKIVDAAKEKIAGSQPPKPAIPITKTHNANLKPAVPYTTKPNGSNWIKSTKRFALGF